MCHHLLDISILISSNTIKNVNKSNYSPRPLTHTHKDTHTHSLAQVTPNHKLTGSLVAPPPTNCCSFRPVVCFCVCLLGPTDQEAGGQPDSTGRPHCEAKTVTCRLISLIPWNTNCGHLVRPSEGPLTLQGYSWGGGKHINPTVCWHRHTLGREV